MERQPVLSENGINRRSHFSERNLTGFLITRELTVADATSTRRKSRENALEDVAGGERFQPLRQRFQGSRSAKPKITGPAKSSMWQIDLPSAAKPSERRVQ